MLITSMMPPPACSLPTLPYCGPTNTPLLSLFKAWATHTDQKALWGMDLVLPTPVASVRYLPSMLGTCTLAVWHSHTPVVVGRLFCSLEMGRPVRLTAAEMTIQSQIAPAFFISSLRSKSGQPTSLTCYAIISQI